MSRRHSSSRRRNYGRRQHEVRERRPRGTEDQSWEGRAPTDEWRLIDLDDQSNESADSLGGNAR